MSADELRAAAKVLRERAEAATQPSEMYPWGDTSLPQMSVDQHADSVKGYLGGTWGDYYATLHPGVGLPLAGWLDEAAGLVGALDADPFFKHPAGLERLRDHALTVARAILAGAS